MADEAVFVAAVFVVPGLVVSVLPPVPHQRIILAVAPVVRLAGRVVLVINGGSVCPHERSLLGGVVQPNPAPQGAR